MDEAQATSVFQELYDALDNLGYAWVRQQLRDAIAAGRVESVARQERGVRQPPQTDDVYRLDEPSQRTPRRESAIRSAPYSPREQLRLLIEALRHVVADVSMLEDAVLEFSGSWNDVPRQVRFSDEEGVPESGQEFGLDQNLSAQRRSSVASLTAALDRLEERL